MQGPAGLEVSLRTAWVFDLDGTLTVPVHDFDAIRAELGLPAGRPILEELARLTPIEAEPKRAQLDLLERELALAATPASGAVELIGALAGRPVRLGIVTRNSRANARLTLDAIGVGHWFRDEDVLGRGEARPKPHPAGLLDLLTRWEAQPSEAVMVGDDRFDLEAGRAAGVATVHVDAGGGRAWPALTDLHARTLSELL